MFWFSTVPWTRITGRGWAELGRQAQSFAPGGALFGAAVPIVSAEGKL